MEQETITIYAIETDLSTLFFAKIFIQFICSNNVEVVVAVDIVEYAVCVLFVSCYSQSFATFWWHHLQIDADNNAMYIISPITLSCCSVFFHHHSLHLLYNFIILDAILRFIFAFPGIQNVFSPSYSVFCISVRFSLLELLLFFPE